MNNYDKYIAIGISVLILSIVVLYFATKETKTDGPPKKVEYWNSSELTQKFKGYSEVALKLEFGEPNQNIPTDIDFGKNDIYYNKELFYSDKLYQGKFFDFAVFKLDRTGVIEVRVSNRGK